MDDSDGVGDGKKEEENVWVVRVLDVVAGSEPVVEVPEMLSNERDVLLDSGEDDGRRKFEVVDESEITDVNVDRGFSERLLVCAVGLGYNVPAHFSAAQVSILLVSSGAHDLDAQS